MLFNQWRPFYLVCQQIWYDGVIQWSIIHLHASSIEWPGDTDLVCHCNISCVIMRSRVTLWYLVCQKCDSQHTTHVQHTSSVDRSPLLHTWHIVNNAIIHSAPYYTNYVFAKSNNWVNSHDWAPDTSRRDSSRLRTSISQKSDTMRDKLTKFRFSRLKRSIFSF